MRGEPEQALSELTLLQGLRVCLEGKPTGRPMTMPRAMGDVAIADVYAETINYGLRWQIWREPELAVLQDQLSRVDLVSPVWTALESERAGDVRLLESGSRSETARIYHVGGSPVYAFWQKIRSPGWAGLGAYAAGLGVPEPGASGGSGRKNWEGKGAFRKWMADLVNFNTANKYTDYDFRPGKPLSQDVEGERANVVIPVVLDLKHDGKPDRFDGLVNVVLEKTNNSWKIIALYVDYKVAHPTIPSPSLGCDYLSFRLKDAWPSCNCGFFHRVSAPLCQRGAEWTNP